MATQRDVFVFITPEGRKDEAIKAMSSWLEGLADYPGFLGGSVFHEIVGELPDGTIGLTTDFESLEATNAAFTDLKESGKGWPFQPNTGTSESDDQAWVLYPDKVGHAAATGGSSTSTAEVSPLNLVTFDRGEGLLARLLHVHAEVAFETGKG